jgi:hypothetical protein
MKKLDSETTRDDVKGKIEWGRYKVLQKAQHKHASLFRDMKKVVPRIQSSVWYDPEWCVKRYWTTGSKLGSWVKHQVSELYWQSSFGRLCRKLYSVLFKLIQQEKLHWNTHFAMQLDHLIPALQSITASLSVISTEWITNCLFNIFHIQLQTIKVISCKHFKQ